MRRLIFRVLAGLLGVLFVVVLFLDKNLPLRQSVPQGLMAAAFLLYAIWGEHDSIYRLIGIQIPSDRAHPNPNPDPAADSPLDAKHKIAIDERGVELIAVSPRSRVWRIEWADVQEIAGWKDDCGTYDKICLGFRIGKEQEFDWCDENQRGWHQLLDELEQRFSIKSPDWWMEISVPAFETKWTVLWKKPRDSPLSA